MPFVDLLLSHPYPTIFLLPILTIVTLRPLLSLISHIRYARSTGLNYLIYPFEIDAPIIVFLLTQPKIHSLIRRTCSPAWQDYIWLMAYNTHWWVKDRMSQRYGDIFLAVSPCSMCLFASNTDAITAILGDPVRFPKMLDGYDDFRLYGPNILSTEGTQWAHHRKFVAPAFAERNNRLVWATALQQAVDMVESWEKNEAENERYTPNLLNSLMSLTMHTVAGAAYGIPMSFSGGESVERPGKGKDLFTDGATPPTGFTYTFRQALSFIAGDIIRHVLITTRLPSWLPIPFLRPYQRAHKDFTGYLHALTTRAGTSGRNTLLDLLVSADGLSSEELTGNLFIFTLAGQETTAQTLNFAFLMLALNPEAQEWVFANVDAVLKDQPRNTNEWKYPEVFPRLVAPLCLMLETLRLCNIVPAIPKYCPSPTILHLPTRAIALEPMNIVLSSTSVSLSPTHYGTDAHRFLPQRWDARDNSAFLARNKGKAGMMAAGLEHKTVHKPQRGAWLGFSDGERMCIGRKFAQVVFVAVVAVVVREFEVFVEPGEEEEVRKGMERGWAMITLQARGEGKVRFRRRR